IVAGESGEPFQRIGETSPKRGGGLSLNTPADTGQVLRDGKLAVVADNLAGARVEPFDQALSVAAKFGAAPIESIGRYRTEILTGSGKRRGFGVARPAREVIFPHVAGVDGIRRVGNGKPALAAVDELGAEVESRGARSEKTHLTPALSPLGGRRGRT